MSADTMRTRVLLSLQRALLGEVFPSLRAVTAEWVPERVQFWAYVDGEPRHEDIEALSCVSAEVAADFEPGVEVDHHVVRKDAPAPIEDLRTYVYRRQEP